MSKDRDAIRRFQACAAWTVVAFAGACLISAGPILAQGTDKVSAGFQLWRTSGCGDCHGVFADGMPEDDDYPIGANLRTTKLDGAALRVTIRCGRPGRGMPAFDSGSYTVRACNGRTLGDVPDNLQPAPRQLSLDEIDAVIAYCRRALWDAARSPARSA